MMRTAIVVTFLLIFLLGMRLLLRKPDGVVSNGATVSALLTVTPGMDEQGARVVTISLPAAKSLSLRKPPSFEVRSDAGEMVHAGAFEFG